MCRIKMETLGVFSHSNFKNMTYKIINCLFLKMGLLKSGLAKKCLLINKL